LLKEITEAFDGVQTHNWPIMSQTCYPLRQATNLYTCTVKAGSWLLIGSCTVSQSKSISSDVQYLTKVCLLITTMTVKV